MRSRHLSTRASARARSNPLRRSCSRRCGSNSAGTSSARPEADMAVRRHPDLAAVARAMADELPSLVQKSIDETFECHLVLSGGNTPKALFKELVSRGREYLPWDQINLWWGDERCVPRDHEESNFGMAYAELIEPLGIDSSLVHRMRGEDPPDEAAKAYEEHIYNSF